METALDSNNQSQVDAVAAYKVRYNALYQGFLDGFCTTAEVFTRYDVSPTVYGAIGQLNIQDIFLWLSYDLRGVPGLGP